MKINNILIGIVLVLSTLFSQNTYSQKTYSFECVECDITRKADCKDCGGRVSQSTFSGIRVKRGNRVIKELHYPFEIHRVGGKICIEELADDRETYCVGREQTAFASNKIFFDSLLTCQKNIVNGTADNSVETITSVINTINGNPIGIYISENGTNYTINENITSATFTQDVTGDWFFNFQDETKNTTTQNLCTIVADCLPTDVDTTINGLDVIVTDNVIAISISDNAGQTFTDNFTLVWDSGIIDTTGLKNFIQSLDTRNTLVSTDESVGITPTTLADGSISYDLNVELFDTDTTGLKQLITECIPTDIDTTVNGLNITVATNQITVDVTNTAGETFSDNFALVWDSGIIDTAGMKTWLEDCIPVQNTYVVSSSDNSADVTVSTVGNTITYDVTVDLFDTDTTGLKGLIEGCIPTDIDNTYVVSDGGDGIDVVTTTVGNTITYTVSIVENEIGLFDIDTTGLKQLIKDCIPVFVDTNTQNTVSTSDSDVTLTPTTNVDGTTNYDIAVDVQDVQYSLRVDPNSPDSVGLAINGTQESGQLCVDTSYQELIIVGIDTIGYIAVHKNIRCVEKRDTIYDTQLVYVPSVDSLRNLTGNDWADIYLQSYWEGLGYGNGRFSWHPTDITGRGDDGGISFDANGNGFWVRNDRTFRATYFGGVDESDLSAIGKVHSGDELQNMFDQAPRWEEIIFDDAYLFYTLKGMDIFREVTITGYGSILKRGNAITATAIALPVGTNTFTVDDASLFEVGMDVGFCDGANSTPNVTITDIVGNTITVSQIITATSTTLSTSTSLITANFLASGNTCDYITVKGLTLNGNRENQTSCSWWQTNIDLDVQSDHTSIIDVNVVQSHSEAMLLGGESLFMDNIRIDSVGGNGIHLSGTNSWTGSNIDIRNTQLYLADSGHEDGGFILSNDVTNGNLTNLYVENSLAVIGSIDSPLNGYNSFENIRGKDCTYFLEAESTALVGNRVEGTILDNFHGENCGQILMEHQRNIKISNGTLINTFIFSRSNDNLVIDNVTVDFTGNTTSTGIIIETGINCEIVNSKVEGGNTGLRATNGPVLGLRVSNSVFEDQLLIGANIIGDVSMIENKIIKTNQTIGSFYVGIRGEGEGLLIKDNDINILASTPTSYGILVDNNANPRGVLILENTVKVDPGSETIRISGGHNNAEVHNNYISRVIQNLAGASTTQSGNIIVSGY